MNNPHKDQNYTQEDKKQCPFYNKKLQQTPYDEKVHMSSNKKNKKKCPMNQLSQQDLKKIAENDNDEQNFQGSSCPIMQTKKENQNPGLFIAKPTYPVPYVSPFSEFLEQQMSEKNNYLNWNNYPIYLKESLFYYSENFQKLRKIEVGYKFFASDELREKANQHYYKQEYQTAINCLSKAISIFKWLETNFPKQQNSEDDKNIKEEKFKNQFQDFKQFDSFFKDKLNVLMFQHFDDNNVRLYEYETSKEKQDIEMEKNTLFNLYQNLAMFFLRAGHHKESRQVIKDMEQLGIKNSIFYFRKAQVVFGDASSNLQELKQVQQDMQLAMQLKESEEIYTHNLRFLKMFGLQNHETIFQQLLDEIETKIIQLEVDNNKEVEYIVNKMQKFLTIEQDIIKRGLVPKYSNDSSDKLFGIKNFELKLVNKIENIYQSAIDFYSREDQQEQYESIKKGYINFQEIKQQFEKWWFLQFKNIINNPLYINLIKQKNIEITNEKQKNLIYTIKREKAKEFLNESQIDLQIYQYAVQDIMKQSEIQQPQKQEQKSYLDILQGLLHQLQLSKNQTLLLFVITSLLIVFYNFFSKQIIF